MQDQDGGDDGEKEDFGQHSIIWGDDDDDDDFDPIRQVRQLTVSMEVTGVGSSDASRHLPSRVSGVVPTRFWSF